MSVFLSVSKCVPAVLSFCLCISLCLPPHLSFCISWSRSVCVYALIVLYCAFLPWCVHLGLSGSVSVCFLWEYCTVLSCPGVCIWVCLGLGLFVCFLWGTVLCFLALVCAFGSVWVWVFVCMLWECCMHFLDWVRAFGSVCVWVCLCVCFETMRVLYYIFLTGCMHLGLSASGSVCVYALRVLYCILIFIDLVYAFGLSGSRAVCVYALRVLYCIVLTLCVQAYVEFEFIKKLDDSSYCKPWLSITPFKSVIKPGNITSLLVASHMEFFTSLPDLRYMLLSADKLSYDFRSQCF